MPSILANIVSYCSPASGLTISRPVERLRVIYRCAPTYASRVATRGVHNDPSPVRSYLRRQDLCTAALVA